tara:strand:- start:22506 stop:23402 length:897 start_codon:yes stop_codon:yes gene_type:complete
MKIVINRPQNWPILEKNKKVNVIFPAFGILDTEKQKIKDFLKNWQLEPLFFIEKTQNDLHFLSKSDLDRFEELENALNNDINIIFCGSGGYGSSRIILQLLESSVKIKNKIFLGFSDITSLHLVFNNCFNYPTLHGPMLKQISKGEIDSKSVEFLYNILSQKKLELSYNIKPINDLSKNIKEQKFPKLLGGNLSLIQTSIGTKWQINNNGKYSMLIEEYDEKSYVIDRMLNHLQNAKIFDNCHVILIGNISKVDNQEYLEQILKNFANNINIPIFKIENIGHKKDNLAIPLGVEITVK